MNASILGSEVDTVVLVGILHLLVHQVVLYSLCGLGVVIRGVFLDLLGSFKGLSIVFGHLCGPDV